MVTVMANGCYDCLHLGHVAHLQAAKALGDRLIVALTVDEAVNKGPGRPVFSWEERYRMLWSLACVDVVIRSDSLSKVITQWKPAIYVKGIEYEGMLPEQELVESYGGRVVFLDAKPRYSSTKILSGELLRERMGVDNGAEV